MGKPKVLELTEVERLALEKGFRLGEKHCFRMRCRAVLLKADGLSSAAAGVQTEMSGERKRLGKTFQVRRNRRIEYPFRQRSKTYHGLFGRGCSASGNRARQTEREQGKRAAWEQASGKEASDSTFKRFFISIGARYKRIRKRPRGGTLAATL